MDSVDLGMILTWAGFLKGRGGLRPDFDLDWISK
jgi:hypothetical protein